MRSRANPLSEEDRLRQRAERLLGHQMAGWPAYRHSHAWQPPTDVFETDDALIVLVEVAGMQQSDFTVSLSENLLTIVGVRPGPAGRGICHQMEIHYGEFRTDIYIASPIEPDGIQAHYGDGLLKVTIPKARARRIMVNPNPQQDGPGEKDSSHRE